MNLRRRMREIAFLAVFLMAVSASAATRKHRVHHTTAKRSSGTSHTVARRASRSRVHRRVTTRTSAALVSHTTTRGIIHSRTRRRRPVYNPWTEPTFADSTAADNLAGEDPVVRKAAVDALGHYNGSVVVADPQSGRILSMVNQKLATTGAYEPCSTVKVMVSFASLKEGVVDPDQKVRIARRSSLDMTRALATSNNAYFAKLGEELGFDRVHHYAQLFGLGERAGLNIEGEEPGTLTDRTPADGVGMMTSFGSGIRVTPLELTSIMSTVANGGTMYYLQHPTTPEAIKEMQPQVKRELDIANLIPSVTPGMMGAVEYGTARRASYHQAETLMGKTGTCTDTTNPGVHLGWFGSFTQVGARKLVVVVLLTGGRGVSGPIASGIAGQVYRNLDSENYFNNINNEIQTPISLLSLP
ncbi:MAG TPA: penicillin-binding transpeptidase domain-containing protein [Bryobacteraceae bacterium]|nr:penicillin-binding transpeptidase domain-containing protein [Bryobacteraceae bacterium]